jgi:hypothetical protein
MKHSPILLQTILFLFASQASAQEEPLELKQLVIVGKKQSDTSWSDRPVEARLDDKAKLTVIGIAKQGKKTVFLADKEVSPLIYRKKEIKETELQEWSSLGEIEVRWSLVEPKLRSETEKPLKKGKTLNYYTNVVAEGKKTGKWLGYDEIVYFETEVAPWSKTQLTQSAEVIPSREENNIWGGLGTMHYKAEVRFADGTTMATPGAEASDTFGLLPSVFRVSLRKDDTHLGYVTAYFHVPYVFGSAGGGKNNQTDRYVGADCADALVGALRSQGVKIKYSFVAGLPKYATQIEKTHYIDENGANTGDPITKAQVGDIIRINYTERLNDTSPRTWDHVGLWYEDKSDPDGPEKGGPDGKFDGFDVMIHMTYPYLIIEPFMNRAPATIDILRWKKQYLTTK